MAEPVAPVDSESLDKPCQNSRAAAEALSLGLELLSQNTGSKTTALQMRELARLSTQLVGGA